jgi:hypothetical protein
MADDRLALPEIGVEIPMAEIYENVDLPPQASEARLRP